MKVEHRYVWDVDGGTRVRAPRGKIVPIGSDELEVWPKHCVDGYRCIQCYFIGKTGCAPRFWGPPTKPAQTPGESKAPKNPVERHNPIFHLDADLPSGKGTLYEYFTAQPVEPLNDGGFTEEITERINSRASELFRTLEPYRITDEPCPKCGYQYPLPWGTKKGNQTYFCPRCKRYWTPYHHIRAPKTAVSYGTCLKCGAANQDLGDGLCLKCYDRVCVSTRLKYRHNSQGLCVDCTQPALQHHTRCTRCLERRLSYYHNHSREINTIRRDTRRKKSEGSVKSEGRR